MKAATEDSITIGWAPVESSGAITYKLEMKESKSKNGWIVVAEEPTVKNYITAKQLKPGMLYEFRVRAINEMGEGSLSPVSEPFQCIAKKGKLSLRLFSKLYNYNVIKLGMVQ